jgi:hypothetical protein
MRPLADKVKSGNLKEHPFGEDKGNAAAKYIAQLIHSTIEKVVKRPAAAMKFLQLLATAMADEGLHLQWTTPASFPWANRYYKQKTTQVKLYLHSLGVPFRVLLTTGEGHHPKIDKRKAKNGGGSVSRSSGRENSEALIVHHTLQTGGGCVAEGNYGLLPTICRLLRGDSAPRFGSAPQGQASQPRAGVVEAGSIGSPSNRSERPSNAATADTTSRNRDVKSLRCCRLVLCRAVRPHSFSNTSWSSVPWRAQKP